MKTNSQIKQRTFSKFLKAKAAYFAKKIIDVVQNQAPESLLITSPFNSFEALRPEIKLLNLHFGIDPQRAELEALKSKQRLTASTLKLQVRLISKSGSG